MLNTKGVFSQKSANTEDPTNPKKFNVWVHLGLGFELTWKRKTSKTELLNLVRYWPTIRPSSYRYHDEISIINLQLNNFEPA